MRGSLLGMVAAFALSPAGCAHVQHPAAEPPSSYLAGQLGEPLAWGTEESGTCVSRDPTSAQLMERAQAAEPNVAPRAQHRTTLRLGGGDYLTQGAYARIGESPADCGAANARDDARCAGELSAHWLAPRDRALPCAKL